MGWMDFLLRKGKCHFLFSISFVPLFLLLSKNPFFIPATTTYCCQSDIRVIYSHPHREKVITYSICTLCMYTHLWETESLPPSPSLSLFLNTQQTFKYFHCYGIFQLIFFRINRPLRTHKNWYNNFLPNRLRDDFLRNS